MVLDSNGRRRLDYEAWIRSISVAVTIIVIPGYLAYANLRDTTLLLTERMDTSMARIAKLEGTMSELADRQGKRVPIFDRMVDQVDDHEKRLQRLELRVLGNEQ